jgi:crossover junction endodeoxyribonuclease RuvC
MLSGAMRVIGIDPGTTKLGWGVVERHGTRLCHVAHGTVVPAGPTLSDKLVDIDRELALVLAAHLPTSAAVEAMFFAKNAQSAMKLGHARGVVLLGLRRGGLSVAEYPPARVKRAVVGGGRAEKHQVAHIVAALLRLPLPPQPDAADALAVAITHLNISSFAAAVARS